MRPTAILVGVVVVTMAVMATCDDQNTLPDVGASPTLLQTGLELDAKLKASTADMVRSTPGFDIGKPGGHQTPRPLVEDPKLPGPNAPKTAPIPDPKIMMKCMICQGITKTMITTFQATKDFKAAIQIIQPLCMALPPPFRSVCNSDIKPMGEDMKPMLDETKDAMELCLRVGVCPPLDGEDYGTTAQVEGADSPKSKHPIFDGSQKPADDNGGMMHRELIPSVSSSQVQRLPGVFKALQQKAAFAAVHNMRLEEILAMEEQEYQKQKQKRGWSELMGNPDAIREDLSLAHPKDYVPPTFNYQNTPQADNSGFYFNAPQKASTAPVPKNWQHAAMATRSNNAAHHLEKSAPESNPSAPPAVVGQSTEASGHAPGTQASLPASNSAPKSDSETFNGALSSPSVTSATNTYGAAGSQASAGSPSGAASKTVGAKAKSPTSLNAPQTYATGAGAESTTPSASAATTSKGQQDANAGASIYDVTGPKPSALDHTSQDQVPMLKAPAQPSQQLSSGGALPANTASSPGPNTAGGANAVSNSLQNKTPQQGQNGMAQPLSAASQPGQMQSQVSVPTQVGNNQQPAPQQQQQPLQQQQQQQPLQQQQQQQPQQQQQQQQPLPQQQQQQSQPLQQQQQQQPLQQQQQQSQPLQQQQQQPSPQQQQSQPLQQQPQQPQQLQNSAGVGSVPRLRASLSSHPASPNSMALGDQIVQRITGNGAPVPQAVAAPLSVRGVPAASALKRETAPREEAGPKLGDMLASLHEEEKKAMELAKGFRKQ